MSKQTLKLMVFGLLLFVSGLAGAQERTGGGSDGGGNTYLGRPLESYARNTRSLPAYEKFVAPLLQTLREQKDPKYNVEVLVAYLDSVFQSKIWYFVPGPLTHIPSELLQAAVPTEQGALQGLDHVWIDSGLWDGMGPEDQGRLLLHEAFMGLKLVKFFSPNRQCQILGLGFECSFPGADGVIQLTAKDYTDVQWMTVRLQQVSGLSLDEWAIQLRSRFPFVMMGFERAAEISAEQLQIRLLRALRSGYVPRYGVDLSPLDGQEVPEGLEAWNEYYLTHKTACQIELASEDDKTQLRIQSEDFDFKLDLQTADRISVTYLGLIQDPNTMIGLRQVDTRPRPSGGYTVWAVSLGFGANGLRSLQVQEMIADIPNVNAPLYDVKGGVHFACQDTTPTVKTKSR